MTEFTEEEFEKLIGVMTKSAKSLGDIAEIMKKHKIREGKSEGDAKKEAKDQRKREYDSQAYEINKKFRTVHRTIDVLHGNVGSFSSAVVGLAEKIPVLGLVIGGVAEAVGRYGSDMLKDWRELTDVGQSFGGSMFGMATAAAQAGMTMDQYTKFVKANSKAMAVFGQKDIMNLAKQVRIAGESAGMYGYTMEGLTEVTGQVVELQRLAGIKSIANDSRLAEQTGYLAKEFTDLAKITGTSREEIMKTTMEAMSDVAIMNKFMDNNEAQARDFLDTATKATAVFASLPGEASKFFSQMYTKAAGYGTAMYSSQAQELYEAGMGSVVNAMDSYAAAINSGAISAEDGARGQLEAFKEQVQTNYEGLKMQAMAGNKAAEQVLQMYDQMRDLNWEQYKQLQQQKEKMAGFTKFLADIGSVFQILMGDLLQGVFKNLEDMDQFMQSQDFTDLENIFEKAGEVLGNFIKHLDMKQVAGAVQNTIGALVDFGKTLAVILPTLMGAMAVAVKAISLIGNFFGFIHKLTDAIASPFMLLGKNVQHWVSNALTAGVMLLFGILGKRLISGLFAVGAKAIKTNLANVTARQVFVEGGLGGGSGGGGWGGGGGGGRAAREAEEIERGAAKAGKLGKLGRMMHGKAGAFLGIAAMLGGGALLDHLFSGGGNRADSADDANDKPTVLDHILNNKLLVGAGTIAPMFSKSLGKFGASAGAKLGGKIAGRVGAKALGRVGGMAVPGLGIGIDGMSAANAFMHGNGLAGSLYGTAAALNGLGLLADGTIIGAPIGALLDAASVGVGMAGMAAEGNNYKFKDLGHTIGGWFHHGTVSPRNPKLASAKTPDLNQASDDQLVTRGELLDYLKELNDHAKETATGVNKLHKATVDQTKAVKQVANNTA